MGLQASIDIVYTNELNLLNTLDKLEREGWGYLNELAQISFFEDDDFEWLTVESKDLNLVKSKLEIRFNEDKLFGIIIYAEESNIGCLLHFMPSKKEIMLLLSINRTKINNSDITDFSFYLKRINSIITDDCQIICNQIG